MLRFSLLGMCVWLALAMAPTSASAQQRPTGTGGINAQSFQQQLGLYGQAGMGNTSAFGQSGLGNTQGQTGTNRIGTNSNSAFGTSTNRNATGSSANSFGTSQMGQTGQSGLGTGSQMGQQGSLLGDTSQSMLNPQGQTTGRNGARTTTNQFGNLFQNSARNSAASSLFGGNGQQQRTGSGGQPALRLGFQVPFRPVDDVQTEIQSRLQLAAARPVRIAETKPELSGVNVAVGEAGIVRLTGEVPTEAARRLAGNVIRLEPGVKKVVNELTVTTASK